MPLEAMRNAVRRLMLRGDEAYIDGTSDEALELLTALELTLTHGLKQKAPAAGVAAIAELWAAGPPTLWSVVLALEKFHEPARKTVGFVKSCGGVADGDKGGLWLRMVLNEGCLHSMLRVLLQELPNKERFYDDDAFARSEQWVDVLLSLTAVLDQIVFQFAPPTARPAGGAATRPARDARGRGPGRPSARPSPPCARRSQTMWTTASAPQPRAHAREPLAAAAGGAIATLPPRRRRRHAAGRRARRRAGAPSARPRRRTPRGRSRSAPAPPAPSRAPPARGHRRRRRRPSPSARAPPRTAWGEIAVRALAGASAITSGWGGVGASRGAGGAGCIRRRCVRRTSARHHAPQSFDERRRTRRPSAAAAAAATTAAPPEPAAAAAPAHQQGAPRRRGPSLVQPPAEPVPALAPSRSSFAASTSGMRRQRGRRR